MTVSRWLTKNQIYHLPLPSLPHGVLMVASHLLRPFRLIAILIICSAAISYASAVSITESPDHLNAGQMMTITIQDLPDNALFTLLLDTTFLVAPSQPFLFETTNFYMPIKLNNGKISASTQNTQKTALWVKKGSKTQGVRDDVNADGIFTVSEDISIPSGTFDYIRLEGTSSSSSDRIIAAIQLTGNKAGPASSKLSFVVNGIENGEVYITVLVDGSTALSKKVTVGSGLQTGSGGSTPAFVTSTTTVSGTTTPTSVEPMQAGEALFYSVDRNVVLKVPGVDHAGLVMIQSPPAPSDWIQMSDAYLITPVTVTFPTSATISFIIPGTSGTNTTNFIGRYENTTWMIVPSTAAGNAISGRIDHPGTFALMALKKESTITPGSPVSSVPTTVAVIDIPRVTPVAQDTTTPMPTTRAPLDVIIVIGACGAGIVLASRTRQ
jgi:hypothetical protein